MTIAHFRRIGSTVGLIDGEVLFYPDMPENTAVIRKMAHNKGAVVRIPLLTALLEKNEQQSALWQITLAHEEILEYIRWEMEINPVVLTAAKKGLLPSEGMEILILVQLTRESDDKVKTFLSNDLVDLLNLECTPKLGQIVKKLNQNNKLRFYKYFTPVIFQILIKRYSNEDINIFDKFLNYLEYYEPSERRLICFAQFIAALNGDNLTKITMSLEQIKRFFPIVKTYLSDANNYFIQPFIIQALSVSILNREQLLSLFNLLNEFSDIQRLGFAKYVVNCVTVDKKRWAGYLTLDDMDMLEQVMSCLFINTSKYLSTLFWLCDWQQCLINDPGKFLKKYFIYNKFDSEMCVRLTELVSSDLHNILKRISMDSAVSLIRHIGLSRNIFLALIYSEEGMKTLYMLNSEQLYDLITEDITLKVSFLNSPFSHTSFGKLLANIIKLDMDKYNLETIVREKNGIEIIQGFKPSVMAKIICSPDKKIMDVIGSIVMSPYCVFALVHYVCHHLPSLSNIDLSKLQYETYTEQAMYVYFAVHQLADVLAANVAVNYKINRFYPAIDSTNAVQAAIKLFLKSCHVEVNLNPKEQFQVNNSMLSSIQQIIALKSFRRESRM